MAGPDNMQAFVLAAELGSFSAAARRMGKAQSAISTSIANLEIDCGVELFDRTARNPVLTVEGKALLPHARGILLGHREFAAKASSMAEGIEASLCVAVEVGISVTPLVTMLSNFDEKFPHVSLEILVPSPDETPALLKNGRADIGLMTEQESYPLGFQFRGVGYSKLVIVCAPTHPLASRAQVSYRDLRQYRQLIRYNRPAATFAQQSEQKSPMTWRAENPALMAEIVAAGMVWAELPLSVVAEYLDRSDLIELQCTYQQNDLLEGIDLIWTERRALGIAGQWLRDEILKLPQDAWLAG